MSCTVALMHRLTVKEWNLGPNQSRIPPVGTRGDGSKPALPNPGKAMLRLPNLLNPGKAMPRLNTLL